jgi:Ca2+-binding RTX toxin-like protein
MNRDDAPAVTAPEPLEPRRLLSSVTLDSSNNLLTIVGNQTTANTISVGYSPGKRYVVTVVNGVAKSFRRNDVGSIRIFGGNLADSITISEARGNFDKNVRAVCGAGDDTFLGGHEEDVVFGDDGNDFISLGTNDDAAVGGNGNDRIIAGDNRKLIFGGAGDDVIVTGNGRGYIFGEDGNDAIMTHGENYEIFGDQGVDTLTGGGRDTLWGGGGSADVLHKGTEVHQSEFHGFQKIIDELIPQEPALPAGAT